MNILDNISHLFMNMEAEVGTRDLAEQVLIALSNAISNIKVNNDQELRKQFTQLLTYIKNTQPRIGLIIDDFYRIWISMNTVRQKHSHVNNTKKTNGLKRTLLRQIEKIKKMNRENRKAIITIGQKCIKKGDTILIHSLSHTVLDLLKSTYRKKHFRCIVAEQEYAKTQEIIHELYKAQIPFRVVPEHMLAHIEELVDKVFLGAVTLNSSYYVVGDIGITSIVSEFYDKVPIYLFINTRKCSYWKAKNLYHSFKEKQVCSHIFRKFIYRRIKFSHDRVPLDHFHYVVTEQKIFSSQEMHKWYKAEYRKRSVWRQKFIKQRIKK